MIRLTKILTEQTDRDDDIAYIKRNTKNYLDSSFQKKPLPKTYIDSLGEKVSMFSSTDDIELFMDWYLKNFDTIGTDKYLFNMIKALDPAWEDNKFHPARTAYQTVLQANPEFITDFGDSTSWYSYYEIAQSGAKGAIKVAQQDQDNTEETGICSKPDKDWLEDSYCYIKNATGPQQTLAALILGSAIFAYHKGGYFRIATLGFNRRSTVKAFGRLVRKNGAAKLSKTLIENPGFLQAHYLRFRKLRQANTIENLTNRALQRAEGESTKGLQLTAREARAIKSMFASKTLYNAISEAYIPALERMVNLGYIGSTEFVAIIEKSNIPRVFDKRELINKVQAATYRKYGGRTEVVGKTVKVSVPMQQDGLNYKTFTAAEIDSGAIYNWAHWSPYSQDVTATMAKSKFAKKRGYDLDPNRLTTVSAPALNPEKFNITREYFNKIVKQKKLFANRNLDSLFPKIDMVLKNGVLTNDTFLKQMGTKENFVQTRINSALANNRTPRSKKELEGSYDLYQLIKAIKGL